MVGLKVFLEEIKGDNPGKVYILSRGTTRLGRKNADIELSNERISARHCELHYSGTRIILIDKNSTNSTYVNGKKTKRIALRDGDVISLGGISEKSSAVFKLRIEGEFKKVVYVINKELDSRFKHVYLTIIILAILIFVWLLIPPQQDKFSLSGKRPWEDAQELTFYPSYGKWVKLVLDDEVMLPPEGDWKTEVRYELVKGQNNFEPRLYITSIYNDVADPDRVLEASVTVQRFKPDFIGDVNKDILSNFVWHEERFLKNNKISPDNSFNYSKTKLCTWQSIIWKDPKKFNLYANCITQRGRILLQAGAFDIHSLKRLLNYFAETYKEGPFSQNQ